MGKSETYPLYFYKPSGTRFVFISREELLAQLRNGDATIVSAESIVDRALVEALRDPPN
jgi:uncharacterized protein YqfA (UPF0365 family)